MCRPHGVGRPASRWRVLASLAFAGALLGLAASSAGATFPGKNGLFVFGMGREYESTEEDAGVAPSYVGLVRRDGRMRRKLVSGGSPAVSPGGRMLALAGHRRGIVLRRLDGRLVERLTYGISDEEPAWSPSGRRIAFSRGISTESEYYEYRFERSGGIYTISRDGRKPAPRLLVSGGEEPAWSSQGEIAFVSYDSSQRSVQVRAISANGGPIRTLATDGFNPDWSPSGERLAFITFGEPFDRHNKLFVVNRDGSGLRRVYRGRQNLLSPTWSPDGRTIAFLEGNRVLAVRANGGTPRALFRLPRRDLYCEFCESWVERPEWLAWQPLRARPTE
jgi:dipeptidyl aminopeptidase/acylaminoacyl peptidase